MVEEDATSASAGAPGRDHGMGGGKHKLSIHGKLGRGTFGSVYKGVLGGYNGPVAVKVLDKPEDMSEAEATRMFLREAQILEKCKHR
jgi:serine/threonine protein kinase